MYFRGALSIVFLRFNIFSLSEITEIDSASIRVRSIAIGKNGRIIVNYDDWDSREIFVFMSI